jgi:two-component system chemotaxis response regulator CheB
VAAILTGMGDDGVEGLRAVRDAGGITVAQDEASSVVFGMPQAALQSGAARHCLPLAQIAEALCRFVGARSRSA